MFARSLARRAAPLLACALVLFATPPANHLSAAAPAANPPHEAYLKASNTDADDRFGMIFALDGDTLVVGAPFEDSAARQINGDGADNSAASAGAAYVFVRANGVWSQQAYLKASNADAGDLFGWSVAISGDTIVVGARAERSRSRQIDGDQADNNGWIVGAAYVFVRTGTTWSQQAYLKASNADDSDSFGFTVAADGNTAGVGAYGEASAATGVGGDQSDNSAKYAGAAYVFVRDGTTWSQQAYLKASNTDAGDVFSFPLALDGDTLATGAYEEDSAATGVNGDGADDSALESGAAYVFVRTGTTWSLQAYLKASNTEAGDGFGTVALDGNTIVVGATLEDSAARGVGGAQGDNSAPDSGAAYVFVREGGTWRQQAYLKASNAEAGDEFGFPALDGGALLLGAAGEDSAATGMGGAQGDNSAPGAGAAYLFQRMGDQPTAAWSQRAYLKASNTGAGDRFNRPAISGSIIAIAAPTEASAATGVNGDQASNSAPAAGAAYALTLPQFAPVYLPLAGRRMP